MHRDRKFHSSRPYQVPRQTTAVHRSNQRPHQSNQQVPPRELLLTTNAYSLINRKRDTLVYKYSLSFELLHLGKNKSDLINKSNVSRLVRAHFMAHIGPQLTGTKDSKKDQSLVISWSLDAVYSTYPLMLNQSQPESQEATFGKQIVKLDVNNHLNMTVTIKRLCSFRMDSIDHRFEIVSALLHHQPMIDMIKYGSVYFKQPKVLGRGERLDLISELTIGFNMSGLLSCEDGSSIVVINSTRSYLTEQHRLIDLVASYIFNKPMYGIELLSETNPNRPTSRMRVIPELSALSESDGWQQSFKTTLNGYKCRAQVGSNSFSVRFCLSEHSAINQLIIKPDGVSRISVANHYRDLGIVLTYPNLPCLVNQSGWFPLELCTLEPGQKTPIFRLSSKAASNLINLNKLKPNESKRLSSNAKDEIVSLNSKHMKDFGLELSQENVTARGFPLTKPVLQFSNQNLLPVRDLWESGMFYEPIDLVDNWCVINTTAIDRYRQDAFFNNFSHYCRKFGFQSGLPQYISRDKGDFLQSPQPTMDNVIKQCKQMTNGNLRFLMFVIDSTSTQLNRLIHLSFDDHPNLTATCLRVDSIMNVRQQNSIFRTLVHKLNARLGGTNVTYDVGTLKQLNLAQGDLLVIGLDVTHPDNELNGVSIVGCAYTFSSDLFKHKSLVWPQRARTEIILKMDTLMRKLLTDYRKENGGQVPKHIIIYRDGVSHEEFDRVRETELFRAEVIIKEVAKACNQVPPKLSFIIAQKRHTMRFYQSLTANEYANPPSGTLIDQDIVTKRGSEFFLYSNINNHSTSRPLHYHILQDGLGFTSLQKLTYYLCFNFGKCSGTLSMPSSLRYAHNAAYDARNRVIAAREFSETKFYTSKFFC